MLDACADKDAKDNDGWTALIFASIGGHESCVRALLYAGADKDAKTTTNGSTALIWASENGHESCVQALLDAGADRDAKDNKGRTALMRATRASVGALLRGSKFSVGALLRGLKFSVSALLRGSKLKERSDYTTECVVVFIIVLVAACCTQAYLLSS